jgi:hypothetical protein
MFAIRSRSLHLISVVGFFGGLKDQVNLELGIDM